MGRRANDIRVLSLRSDETDTNKERLLTAARTLFAAHGVAGTQIAQITREAGTGISMFYRYFKDKTDVLNCILESFLDELDTGLANALAGVHNQTPLEQLFSIRKVFQHVIGLLVSRPELAAILSRSGFAADEKTESMLRERISKVALDIASHIESAEEAGLVVVKQKEVLGHAAAGLALQVANKLIQEGTPSLEEAVDTCTRFTIGGLLVFCPAETFNKIYPALLFMLQPVPGINTPTLTTIEEA